MAVETVHGAFVLELDPDRAPRTVERFLERAGLAGGTGGAPDVAPASVYAGSELCRSLAHGYLLFGCAAGPGNAVRRPQPDEIDGVALGLGERRLSGARDVEWLWQQEVFPRYVELRESGRPVPPGLASLVETVRRDGTAALGALEGRTWLWYLEAVGYRYTRGRSDLGVTRGTLATANLWPGEADERFIVALADLPERDGRATVFGRIVDGWETLDALAALPVDKGFHPVEATRIVRMTLIEPAPAEDAGGEETHP